MSKNIVIGILGAAVVALMAVVAFQAGKGSGDSDGREEGADGTNARAKPLPVAVTNTLPALKPGDTKRIPSQSDAPQHIISLFEAEGKGTYAAWGGAADADFYYMLKLAATSKVESKDESESGRVRVSEIRTFHDATEAIKPVKAKLRVDMSTVPLDQIETHALLLSGVVSLFAPVTGAALADTVHELREEIESLDGLDAQPIIALMAQFGIDVQKILDTEFEGYLNGLLEKVHSHVNAVQGKSYRFIYWTDKAGEPLRVRYENVDRSPISLEEQNVLNYVNLFIDCHILSDMDKKPGEHWTVGAPAIAAMFGAMADGTCSGEVEVTRGNDMADGNWTLSIAPATINLLDDKRNPMGNVKIDGGNGVGDPRRAVLREMQLFGHGKLRKRDSSQLWIYEFGINIDGDCKFRSTLMPRRED